MKAYEDLLFEQWRVQVDSILPQLLKRNLLSKPETTPVTLTLDDPDNLDKDDAGN